MTDRLRVGVVGCGVIGSKHIEVASASPAIELTAVAHLQQELAHRTAAQYENALAPVEAAGLLDFVEGEHAITRELLTVPAWARVF